MARPWQDVEIWNSYVPRFDAEGRKVCQYHPCNNLLTGRQERWCSAGCANDAWASCVFNAQRKRILRRDDYTCQKCHYKGWDREWEVDHIIPLIEGGKLCDPANLRTLCRPCHKEETKALAARLAAARRAAKRLNQTALEFA
jgi:5-methylcytosine-specific restriction protein A